MREVDGMRILGSGDGHITQGHGSTLRELITSDETLGRWRLGEVTATPDEEVGTHVHPGEAEAFIVLEGEMELHGAEGVSHVGPGDVVFIPPDTEHGLRTPNGGRWLAIWPIGERVPGKRYAPWRSAAGGAGPCQGQLHLSRDGQPPAVRPSQGKKMQQDGLLDI